MSREINHKSKVLYRKSLGFFLQGNVNRKKYHSGPTVICLSTVMYPAAATASLSINDPVSETSGSSYRPFDEILMEGASCGSVRALAVGVCEAAFVANGLLRNSTTHRDSKVCLRTKKH